MTDERRVTRHEPITTVVEIDGKDVTFVAKPLPWRKRNDLGEALLRMFGDALDKVVQAGMDKQGMLIDAVFDYGTVWVLAYPDGKKADFEALDFDEMVEVLTAGLLVNGLDRLAYVLDPDRKKDLMTGGDTSAPDESAKMPSPIDSSSSESDSET